MVEATQGANGRVFISYSRKDKAFVQKLNDALDTAGVQAWVDWEGIELASDWMATITSAIQGTDAFLFVISPDSLKSMVCTDELGLTSTRSSFLSCPMMDLWSMPVPVSSQI
jgi:hypothetical protein